MLKQFDTTKFHDYRNAVITKTLLDTGMRIGECFSMKPDHIDFIHRSILVVNPKKQTT
ncbi:Phage integrase family protein [compost metagenome]